MATPIKKITEAEMDAKGVCASPDVLEGTVAENKAVFDRMVRQIVAPAYNACAEAVDEINARQEQIATEESARVEAEKERAGAETDRVSAENARAAAESARAEAETGRANAEEARVTAETNRAAAEEERAAAETQRKNAEAERAAAERARETAESERDNAEKIRQQNETARQSNETDRVNAETARNVWENYDAQKSYVPGNKVAYKGSSYRNIQACTGVLPSNTAYWLMIAQRGVDGEGAGDMLEEIYDPQGKKQDIFDYVDTHKNDESIHVTAEEKAEWSGKAAGTHASQHAVGGSDPITPESIGAIPATEKGQADGVASLDSSGKVPSGQLPEISSVKTYIATIGTAWTEDENTGVKYQSVAISGVTAAQTAKVDHAYTGDGTSDGYAAFVEAENQYLTYITNGYAETYDGGVKFYIFGNAPTVSIPIVVEVA